MYPRAIARIACNSTKEVVWVDSSNPVTLNHKAIWNESELSDI
jgi:hypothetical protein